MSPSSQPVLAPTLEFMRLLWDLDSRLQSASKTMADTLGVTGPQRLVIRMIGLYPGITASDLSSLLRLHKSTLTGVLQRLERRRTIRRTADKDDRRVSHFELTTEGQRINRHRLGTIEARLGEALGGLPEADVAAARRVLITLADAIGGVDGRER